jgi:hypothetical protein
VACRRLYEFRVAAINAHPRDLLLRAEVFVSFTAHLTLATAPKNPRHANPVANFVIANRRAFLDDTPGNFVPEDQRFLDDLCELRPVTVSNVEIGMANAARFDFDENFIRAWNGTLDFFESERSLKIVQDCGFHGRDLMTYRRVPESKLKRRFRD